MADDDSDPGLTARQAVRLAVATQLLAGLLAAGESDRRFGDRGVRNALSLADTLLHLVRTDAISL